jgi:hypothetical protein
VVLPTAIWITAANHHLSLKIPHRRTALAGPSNLRCHGTPGFLMADRHLRQAFDNYLRERTTMD